MNRILLSLSLALSFALSAQDIDSTQTAERLNPVLEVSAPAEVNYADYPSVKLANNRVQLNGDDWTALGAKYRAALAGDSLFTVVYLGNSHVQADFNGAALRNCLAQGHLAGRGIIIPFRLAGTNEPPDYTFRTANPCETDRIMRQTRIMELPFTGIGVRPQSSEFTFDISCKTPFRRLRFHTTGGFYDITRISSGERELPFRTLHDPDAMLDVQLPDTTSFVSLTMQGDLGAIFGGIELLNDSTGVLTHSIGNNGTSFCDYNTLPGFAEGIASLHPDLIVIALGTNEAFGRIGMDALRADMQSLLDKIERCSPGTKVLLVGPTECYKKIRRNRKRRRRTVQVVNTKTTLVARTMRLFAEEKGIPYYNHYAVAGNAASQRGARLLGADGVHFTAAAYRLWGSLLGDAIIEKLKQ